jgi:hypothetical protein
MTLGYVYTKMQMENSIKIKPIEGYEGLYSIDANGTVYSHGRNGTRGGICREWIAKHGYPDQT